MTLQTIAIVAFVFLVVPALIIFLSYVLRIFGVLALTIGSGVWALEGFSSYAVFMFALAAFLLAGGRIVEDVTDRFRVDGY